MLEFFLTFLEGCFILLVFWALVHGIAQIEELIRKFRTPLRQAALIQNDPVPSSNAWKLEQPIFRLPTGDCWTLGDACQGVLILGATGSGKSSGSADALANKLLRAGAGGLVLCVKVGEADYWQEIAKITGRENDLIRITEKAGGLNVFDYELRRCGRGAGLTLNLLNLFRQLQDLVESGGGRKMGPDFWERACARCIANAIQLQAALDEPFTLAAVSEIVNSAPHSLQQANSDEWEDSSCCAKACNAALDKGEHNFDVKRATRYFTLDLPNMGERQRSGIFETWEGLADPLLRTPLRQKFCETTTWVPEDAIARGKIIIIDLPVKEFDFAGKMAGVIAKFMFQKAVERRPASDERRRRPCFIFADEFQHFLTSYDPIFQQTSRSSKTIIVYPTQNIPGMLAALGGEQARPFANNLLGNLTTHIYHSNAELDTNRYASDTIGRDWQDRVSISSGQNRGLLTPPLGGNNSASVSVSQQMEHIVPPVTFTKMRTGGLRNNRIVDGVFFQASRTFSHDRNYCKVYFTQRDKA